VVTMMCFECVCISVDWRRTHDGDTEPDVNVDDDEVPRRKPSKRLDRKKTRRSKSGHDSDMEPDDTEPDDNGDDDELPRRKPSKRLDRKKTKRSRSGRGDYESHAEKKLGRRRNCPWTSEDLVLLQKSFQAFFKLRRPPDFKSIEVAQATFPQLQKRSKAQIKSRLWHLIQTGH